MLGAQRTAEAGAGISTGTIDRGGRGTTTHREAKAVGLADEEKGPAPAHEVGDWEALVVREGGVGELVEGQQREDTHVGAVRGGLEVTFLCCLVFRMSG